jgi:hypothetical protein
MIHVVDFTSDEQGTRNLQTLDPAYKPLRCSGDDIHSRQGRAPTPAAFDSESNCQGDIESYFETPVFPERHFVKLLVFTLVLFKSKNL